MQLQHCHWVFGNVQCSVLSIAKQLRQRKCEQRGLKLISLAGSPPILFIDNMFSEQFMMQHNDWRRTATAKSKKDRRDREQKRGELGVKQRIWIDRAALECHYVVTTASLQSVSMVPLCSQGQMAVQETSVPRCAAPHLHKHRGVCTQATFLFLGFILGKAYLQMPDRFCQPIMHPK